MDSYQYLRVEIAGHVATVTMDRPPVNALNREFREEIVRLFDALSDDDEVRAIVLTGAGKTFSAGADLKERPSIKQEKGAYLRHNRGVRASFDAVMECEKPVIAAINGAAMGAGCVLALCGDILVASQSSFMAMPEVDVGLAGGVNHVRRFFGASDARMLILTAQRVYGPELLRMGVVSRCLPDDALLGEAGSIAAAIAAKSPAAVQAAKRSFNVTEGMALRDGYRFEQSQTAALAAHPDTIEAQSAFAQKRKPKFG